jgi:hypothetical protein
MHMEKNKLISKLVADYLNVPANIQRIANIATFDLYYGPYDTSSLEDDEKLIYTDFVHALDDLLKWASVNVPNALYVDLDTEYVSDKEPEPWLDESTGEVSDPYLENIYKLEGKEILEAIWNTQLVGCF